MKQVLWSGEDVARCTRGTGPTDWHATGLSIDSRTVAPGDLFIALKGPLHDGNDHAPKAIAVGACAAVVSRLPDHISPDSKYILVPDTFAALQDLGSRGRARAQGKIIAVTGSVGKTGSKEQLRTMLGACGTVFASQGSFNNHWGVPLSLAQMLPETAWGVFELGMNHAGEMAALTRQVQPHVALITTIEAVHLEFFTTTEAIADAKAEIFLGMDVQGVAVLNRDNSHFARLVGHARTQGIQTILSFGRSAGADARLLDCQLQADSSIVSAEFFGQPVQFRIGAPGLHYAMNALGTLLAAQAAGAPLPDCMAALAHFTPPSGRGAQQKIQVPGGTITVIDESYNASPVATRAAIAVLGKTIPGTGGRRIAVLGDMRELGATAPQLHAELSAPLCAAGLDLVFCCGHIIQGLFEALPAAMRGRYTADSKALATILPGLLRPGDVVLVKGSKSMHMDVIIKAIQQSRSSAA
ncbi:MAG: UDP-N-acetylmuramoylalanyl-D-glutamyl-2,6-diaminopimelate--D-alanyl-D-alanine ligase [Alphaproteobacteria bacterium]